MDHPNIRPLPQPQRTPQEQERDHFSLRYSELAIGVRAGLGHPGAAYMAQRNRLADGLRDGDDDAVQEFRDGVGA